MSDKRQKSLVQLAFWPESRGEAPMAGQGGSESSVAKRETEGPASTEFLMEEVCERENLRRALKRVMANKGSPGVDGMTVKELSGHLKEHWLRMKAELLAGTYQPSPVLRTEIPKPDGGMRKLGIPTVTDRFIQQAALQVLQKRWDRTFSAHSYGFRPGRSAHQAVKAAQDFIAGGRRWVVDIDLEKFFDRVNHDHLMGRIAQRVKDKRMLRLIRAYLKAGVMACGLVSPTDEGTPQGGPLSPLLSNLVLDELDQELEKRSHAFARYADDCNIYVQSERAAKRVMEGVTDFITRKLKLTVNAAKSAVARPWERKFLGFSVTVDRQPKRRLAPKAVTRFKTRVRELTRRTRGVSLERMVHDLSVYLRGWQGYFGHCQTPSVMEGLNSWIRRRLRCVVWKQWKRGRTRYARLRARGVSSYSAAVTAGSSDGPWHLSKTPALNQALPDAYLATLGLVRLKAVDA
jgi:RNA-directed DNA polymerase